jgi:signal transduction histidine kinase
MMLIDRIRQQGSLLKQLQPDLLLIGGLLVLSLVLSFTVGIFNSHNLIEIVCIPLLIVGAIILLGRTLLNSAQDLHFQIERLQEATKRLESGDLSIHIPALANEELNFMAQNLTAMARTLEEQVNVRKERDQLALSQLAIEETNRARTQFFSVMSHELRTPLTSIIGFSQLLLRDCNGTSLNSRQKGNLERILNNSYRLLTLINDILDAAKTEAGSMGVNYRTVDLQKLLASVVEETQSVARVRGLFLQMNTEEGLGAFETDPVKLRQVLLHLVSNALKFTQQGGVRILAKRVKTSGMLLNSNGGKEELLAIAVQDTGIGIAPEIQERIFEAFYQADSSSTRKYGGTGLGLAIARQYVTLLGGKILVNSTPGQGSVFTVILPYSRGEHHEQDTVPLLIVQQVPFGILERRTS